MRRSWATYKWYVPLLERYMSFAATTHDIAAAAPLIAT
jgi:hypothetical protein